MTLFRIGSRLTLNSDSGGDLAKSEQLADWQLRYLEPFVEWPNLQARVKHVLGLLPTEVLEDPEGLRRAIEAHIDEASGAAREEIARWRVRYSIQRPHSAFGYRTPVEVLTKTTAPAIETLKVSSQALSPSTRPENSVADRP